MASITRSASRDPDHRAAVARGLAEAVERLLAQGGGYTTLGVQRIAAEAGVARSTFYMYFPDKSALLTHVAESATEELFAVARRWLEHGFAELPVLESAIAEIVAQQRAHAPLLGALMEVAGYDDAVSGFWRERVGGFIELLRERIEEGQRAGTIARALAPATTAAWITWGTERLITQHVAEHRESGDEALARGLAVAIWSMLGRELPGL